MRAARLLAEIGDARGRFPTPEALTCLAGAAPSTRQSGKVKIVTFRWAVDKQLRGAVIDFAGDSHHANPWAADLYKRARDRGHDHPHAVRILARAWLHIIWRCWQDHAPYDPAKHRALQRAPKPGCLTQGYSCRTWRGRAIGWRLGLWRAGSGTCPLAPIGTRPTHVGDEPEPCVVDRGRSAPPRDLDHRGAVPSSSPSRSEVTVSC